MVGGMSLTIGSLFSGVGGLERGLELGLGGAVTRWQVEYEEHARLILAQHWPEAERHEDVRHVGAANLVPVDLICGGFPCQPFSTAGKQAGADDERHLWPHFARVVDELEPRWVVGENVPGLLAVDRGRTFGRILADLAGLGFHAEWHVFSAASTGARHLRNRLFLVAAHPDRLWQLQPQGRQPEQRGRPVHRAWHEAEPELVGMVHGLSDSVDRLTRLGNAVVPQQAAVIGRAIRDAEAHWQRWGVMPERIIRPEHWSQP